MFDGTEKGTITDLTAQATRSLYLFSMNSSNGALNLAKCKLYYAKIYDKDTNTLVRHFIPVIDAKNEPCLYEQVEGKFYYNKGTGTFASGQPTGSAIIIGDRARRILKGYIGVNGVARSTWEGIRYVNYIGSSGTQYIDTGISPNANTCTEIKFRFTTLYTSNTPDWIAAVWLNNSPNRYHVMDQDYFNTTFLGCMTTTSSNVKLLQPADTNWHTIKYNDENHKIIFDGTEKTTSPIWANNNTRTLTLFARNDGSINGYSRAGQIEYCKITDTSTNTLLRDFVPALDDNNVPCLYDKVSEQYFYNLGTGTFLYG